MRNPETNLVKNIVAFETHIKLIDNALKSVKTGCKKLQDMKTKLEEQYFILVETHHFYKTDIISKEAKSSEVFNGKNDDGLDSFQYNDLWADSQMAKYMSTTEAIEDKICELEKVECKVAADTSSQQLEDGDLNYLPDEINLEKDSLESCISNLTTQVDSLDKIQIVAASAMEKLVANFKTRLDSLLQKSRNANDETRTAVGQFYKDESAKLNCILLELCKKLDDTGSTAIPATAVVDSKIGGSSGREQVHLEKSKPPRFRGDEVEYPEFKRKWLSIVSKANLPVESEIDKLRDSLPNDAKDQLYGVTTLIKAWEILDKRFGDTRLIANKLKNQLKSVQPEGKSDSERVISLTIKVRTIVTKLEALKMSGALQHDCEFLSAVYCALPSKDQQRWLDYDKSDNHWEDMVKFLDRAYNQATEELSLLATYKIDKKIPVKSAVSKSFAAQAKSDDSNTSDAKEKARKRSEDYCGKCPVCNSNHTWTRSAGDQWPSDRMVSCKKFNDMTVSNRAKAVERAKGCPRCTSWNHSRDACKMPANNCNKEDGNGSKCKGDHSKLLCGSGNAYCFAIKPNSMPIVKQKNKHSVKIDGFSNINENADTVQYIQDIKVAGHDVLARTFWDDGSTRVLIRDEFADSL